MVRIYGECRNLRTNCVTNPLGPRPPTADQLLLDTEFDWAHVGARNAEQCFELIGLEVRQKLPAGLRDAQDAFGQTYSDLQSALTAWEGAMLDPDFDPSKRSQRLCDLERQLDRMQANCESFADAVMSTIDELTPDARDGALDISRAADRIVSLRTAIVDQQSFELGMSRFESNDVEESASPSELVSTGKESQQASSQTKARVKSRRRFGKSAGQRSGEVPSKSDIDQMSVLRTEVRKALKLARVTLKKAKEFGGNPREIARSEGQTTLVLDYALQGTALAITSRWQILCMTSSAIANN
jgi:hypothetical protein